ncbi:MAG TPA: hypothetical protein VGM27_14290 [Acidobacteriaceae bacterium]|jgi:hypothetical protein
MKSRLGFALFLLVALIPLTTAAYDGRANTLVRFKGGIGVDAVNNVTVSGGTTTVSPNTVRGVSPPTTPWVIADLAAKISLDGHILVVGRGLLLSGGDGIGTNAGQSVFATLFCGPAASASASSSSMTGVALDAEGNFTINDVLSPAPPDPCNTPVLLIQTTGGAHPWFAAGIPDQD